MKYLYFINFISKKVIMYHLLQDLKYMPNTLISIFTVIFYHFNIIDALYLPLYPL